MTVSARSQTRSWIKRSKGEDMPTRKATKKKSATKKSRSSAASKKSSGKKKKSGKSGSSTHIISKAKKVVREVVVGAVAGAAKGAVAGAAEAGSRATNGGSPTEDKKQSAKPQRQAK